MFIWDLDTMSGRCRYTAYRGWVEQLHIIFAAFPDGHTFKIKEVSFKAQTITNS